MPQKNDCRYICAYHLGQYDGDLVHDHRFIYPVIFQGTEEVLDLLGKTYSTKATYQNKVVCIAIKWSAAPQR